MSSWSDESRRFIADRHLLAIVDPGVESAFSIIDQLKSFGTAKSIVPFLNFTPNPSWDSLETCLSTIASKGITAVLAVGGGTAIDLAKLSATALELDGITALWNASRQGNEINTQRKTIQLMAIPTTAGTGAEATRFAVLYRDGIKHSIAGNSLRPDQVALDPRLLATLPSHIVADAGLDALCQAMESLWSSRSNQASETEAWAALNLGIKHLANAVSQGTEEALTGMLVSAHRAGKAINLTTTTAPHALSYGLTSKFGIPHGRAVALLFGSIFRHNAEAGPENCTHPLGYQHVETRLREIAECWQQSTIDFADWWNNYLSTSLSVPRWDNHLTSVQVGELSSTVNAKRLANNPTRLSESDIKAIYEGLTNSGKAKHS